MSYHISAICENCGWSGLIEVKDGELVKTQICPACKCQKVTKLYGASATRAMK